MRLGEGVSEYLRLMNVKGIQEIKKERKRKGGGDRLYYIYERISGGLAWS